MSTTIKSAFLPFIFLLPMVTVLNACQTTSTGVGSLDTNQAGSKLLPATEATTQSAEVAELPTATPLDLKLCYPKVSNAPPTIGLKVSRTSSTSCLNGVQVMVAPVLGACMTSGHGERLSRGVLKPHKGIDYQGPNRSAVPVVAAADGKVIVNEFRKNDLGNWIVLDHGNDVYTGYGHLANRPDFAVGTTVKSGIQLAMMGSTGAAAGGRIHLHVEYRTGELTSAANGRFFLLKDLDPFSYPEKCPAS